MYNKTIIIGNLGSDPEMRYMSDGTAVSNFSVASNYRYKTRDGEDREETTWFRVNAWGRLGETTNQYLEKGRQVYVEGRLSQREWEDSGGNTRYSLEVRASEIKFLSGPGPQDAASGGADAQSETAAAPGPREEADDLPW